jgi:CheY-like chemotaxis protein
MPVMDGLTMLAELRQDDWGKSVPVILLTNLSDSVSNAKFPTQKETSYIMKSNWKIEDIVKQVTKILTK